MLHHHVAPRVGDRGNIRVSGARGPGRLHGLRILVVEDMFLIADDLRNCLLDWGCEVVGPQASVDRALDSARAERLDGALLDINLNGQLSFPVAVELRTRAVPFIFLTGYDSESVVPAEFNDIPRSRKPINMARLAELMAARFRPAN